MENKVGATEKELIEFRKKKLQTLEQSGINPYPSKSGKNISATEILNDEDELISSKKEIVAAGRIMALRGHGKLVFVDLSDEKAKFKLS